MNRQLLARVSLSFLCGLQGFATLAIDFNRTHATNPTWARHARFHVVWQSVSVALLSVLELILIWLQGPYQRESFYLALLLAAISPLAFLIAFVGLKTYGGALSDPNGIPPVRLKLFRVVLSIDLNLAAIAAALVSIGVILEIYSR